MLVVNFHTWQRMPSVERAMPSKRDLPRAKNGPRFPAVQRLSSTRAVERTGAPVFRLTSAGNSGDLHTLHTEAGADDIKPYP